MIVSDAIVALVVAALPGATLWQRSDAAPAASDLVVFDGIVPPTPPERYVTVYIDDGTRVAGQVGQESTGRVFRWQVTCVAPDRPTCAWLAGQVKDGLVDARPVVDGWSPGMVEHTFAQLPRPDEQVQDRPVVFAVDTFRLVAEQLPPAGS